MTPQSVAYHVQTYVGSAWRKIGTFFKADYRAPEVLRGKYVFLRFVNRDCDLFMRSRQSNGFSTPVFEKVKADGAVYMVTHSKESGKMLIGHVSMYAQEVNFGQGLQTHAPLGDCRILDNVPRLNFPVAIKTETVQDEQPVPYAVKPTVAQPAAPSPVKQKPSKGISKRCGCYFEDGVISRPCIPHKPVWEGVIRARESQGKSL